MNGHPQRWFFPNQQNIQSQPLRGGSFHNSIPPRGPVPSRFGGPQMRHQLDSHYQHNAFPSCPPRIRNQLPTFNRFRSPKHRMPVSIMNPDRSFYGPPTPALRHQTQPPYSSLSPHNRPAEKQKQTNKIAKWDLPENNRFFCDTCDRGYKDEEKYRTHISEHEKCSHKGCTYVAAPKLVQLHVKMQHQSGLAKKIWSLESPEDIKRWKEERKKNFPTAENIEKKKAALADKIARGEIIEEKQFGQKRKYRGGRGWGQGRGLDKNLSASAVQNGDDGRSYTKKQKNLASHETSNTEHNSLAVFFAETTSGSECDSSVEVKEDGSNTDVVRPSNQAIAAGALGALMSTYIDSEDEEVEKTECDLKTPKRDSLEDTEVRREKSNRNRQKSRGKKNKKNKLQIQPMIDKSLLEKLLAKEIRKERNQILQCVYHIVKKNFFYKQK